MEEIVITHEEIQWAKAQYNDMFTDDQIRDALENQEKARLIQRDVLATAEQRGIEKGIELGIDRGQKQAQRTIASNLLKEGTPVPTVVRLTGLTDAEVRELQASEPKSSN